jgi:hypothetical protein
MVKSALMGESFTLALSRFENTFSSRDDWRPKEAPVARGVVHFEGGTDLVIRSEVTFSEGSDEAKPGYIGGAQLHRAGTDDDPYVIMGVELHDPRGKLAAQLQAAFDSAALSQNRFVHVTFTRPNTDIVSVLADLADGGNAYHLITDIFIRRETILPQAPAWSWAWERF